MKLKLDENLPADPASLLREHGHDAVGAVEEGLGGSPDLDFADVRRFPVGEHAGLVVFRLHDQRWATLRAPVERLLDLGLLEELEGKLAVVTKGRIRLRHAPKPPESLP